MSRPNLYLILAVAIALVAGGVGLLFRPAPLPVVKAHTGGLHWHDGPPMVLNEEKLRYINSEIALDLGHKYPGKNYQFTVTADGNQAVKYDDGMTMPDDVFQETMDKYADRVVQLAGQQVREAQPQAP